MAANEDGLMARPGTHVSVRVMTNSTPAPITARLRHDLLTPVNQIIGYTEMLMEELEETAQETALVPMRELYGAARELTNLINMALPAGDATASAASLPLLLEAPLQIIVECAGNAMQALSGDDAPRIATDLARIQAAAERLGGLVAAPAEQAPSSLAAPVAPLPVVSPVAEIIDIARPESCRGRILLVDDNEGNVEMLARRLQRERFEVMGVTGGRQALDVITREAFDVMLLDVVMPGFDGFQVLEEMQSTGLIGRLPVIMLSAMDEVQTAARCLDLGAEDYLTKPVDPVLLRARIGASLERKRLRDEERRTAEQLRAALSEVEEQRRLAESLLRNILPPRISDELRSSGRVEPKYFDDITVVFTDFVGFTLATEKLAAEELVELLHDYFTEFDHIVRRYGLEKLKTIGDAYMFVGGLPPRTPSHPVDAVLACLEIIDTVKRRRAAGIGWDIRIGVHTGPVIAGVVGIDKFAFDMWGETVNYSARMYQCGEPGQVNISERAFSRVKDFFNCEARGAVPTKERKSMDMFFAQGVQLKLLEDCSTMPPPRFAKRYRTYFDRDVPAFPEFLAGKRDE